MPERWLTVTSEQAQHLAHVCVRDAAKPDATLQPVLLHGAHEEAHVPHRHVRQRVGPVLEHGLVDALHLLQIEATILRDAGVEDVVMAALDHVDGVDLHVTELLDRGEGGSGPLAERRVAVEPLSAKPYGASTSLVERVDWSVTRHCTEF
jgi:hypothetical protein